MVQAGDLVQTHKQWYWNRGLPPVERWLPRPENEGVYDVVGASTAIGHVINRNLGAYSCAPTTLPPQQGVQGVKTRFTICKSLRFAKPIKGFWPPRSFDRMPVETPVLVTNMKDLGVEFGIEKDPALVQFLYNGGLFWVRAACWEHIHADMHVVSAFDACVDAFSDVV